VNYQRLRNAGQTEQERLEYDRLSEAFDAVPRRDGVLPLVDYGCGIDGLLVLEGRYRGQIWIASDDGAYYMPFGQHEELHVGTSTSWTPVDTPREYGFLDWYEHWAFNFPVPRSPA